MTTSEVASIIARLAEQDKTRDQAREDAQRQRAEDREEARRAHADVTAKLDELAKRVDELESVAITWPRLGAIVAGLTGVAGLLLLAAQHLNVK